MNGQHTDLKKHIVHCHGEVAGVEHQAFGEQGEQAVTQHDLCFPPDRNDKKVKGRSAVISICLNNCYIGKHDEPNLYQFAETHNQNLNFKINIKINV